MKVAVDFGGESAECDVSIASGAPVVRGLRAQGHQIVAVDTAVGARGIFPANLLPAQTREVQRHGTSRFTKEPNGAG